MNDLNRDLDQMAIEFCEGAFESFGLSKDRIREHYAPIVRELLDKAIATAGALGQ